MRQPVSIGRILLSLLYLCIAAAILGAIILTIPAKKVNQPRILLGGEEVSVEIADTPAAQEQGLSGRDNLGAHHGMFFVFLKPGFYGFWMKSMRFPIDIIWFDANYRIVDVWEDADLSSYPKVYTPRAPAAYVLEVRAGFFSEHHLKFGNTLEILR